MISMPLRPRSAILLFPLVILAGFSAGFLLSGGANVFLPGAPEATAAATCDNDGTADAGETCSNCPYDVRCSATQKCIAGSCTTSTGCEREDVCGDGWRSGFEACDDGGICTGSLNLSYEGEDCVALDPSGNLMAGVARCRATNGYCLAQGNDGCTANCQDECHPTDSPCLIDSDCCTGESCVNGRCGTGTSPTKSGGTFVEDCTGGGVSWGASVANIGTSNNQYAQTWFDVTPPTCYLKATNFGFGVPLTATINGVEVRIERGKSYDTPEDYEVKLIKGGTITGDNKAKAGTWPDIDTYETYGSSTDKWGISLAPADINASDFGITIKVGGGASGDGDPRVDHMEIKVYYTE